jgi:hypothetical protein
MYGVWLGEIRARDSIQPRVMFDLGLGFESVGLNYLLLSQGSSRGLRRSPQTTGVVIPGQTASWWGGVDMGVGRVMRMRKQGYNLKMLKSESELKNLQLDSSHTISLYLSRA